MPERTGACRSCLVAVVQFPAGRRCWILVDDVDTHVWDVADFEDREAIAVAYPVPDWSGGHWSDRAGAAIYLTWVPATMGDFWWVEEGGLYWALADARAAAKRRTVAERANRRAERQRTKAPASRKV